VIADQEGDFEIARIAKNAKIAGIEKQNLRVHQQRGFAPPGAGENALGDAILITCMQNRSLL
jgi:hypothetical protein